jgi:two-component system response regulator WspF
VRVAIVNDMTMAVETLRRLITGVPGYSVAWIARNGAEALAQCKKDKPDLILMDLVMPVMDGVEATCKIMVQAPCPILVVTAAVEGYSAKVLEALGAGALDAVQTPVFAMYGQPAGADRLKFKIEAVRRLVFEGTSNRGDGPKPAYPAIVSSTDPLIVIGASAGGPAALATIFSNLPPNFSAAIVVIQHIDAQFAPSMANWLGDQTTMTVRTAKAQDQPQPGTVLIASTNDHLVFVDPHNLGYTVEPRESYYRPSIDVFFASVANQWKGDVVAVLLTGMGRDGANGLKMLREKGALTIAQDSKSCVVYGMPKAAMELNAAIEILPLNRIAASLTNFLKAKKQGTYA